MNAEQVTFGTGRWDYVKGLGIIGLVLLYAVTHDAALVGACARFKAVANFALPVRLSGAMLVLGLAFSRTLHPPGVYSPDKRLVGASLLSMGLIIYLGHYGYRPLHVESSLEVGDSLDSARSVCERYAYFCSGYLFAPVVFGFADWAAGGNRRTVALALGWIALSATSLYLGVAHAPGTGLLLGLLGAMTGIAVVTRASQTPWGKWVRFLGRNSILAAASLALCIALAGKLVTAMALIGDSGMRHLAATAIGTAIPILLFWLLRGTRLQIGFQRPRWARLGALFAHHAAARPGHETRSSSPR